MLKCLYYSLVYSHLSYCTAVWASNYPAKLNCLLLLQKRVLRIKTRSCWRDHSRPWFTRFRILNISQINKLQLGELVYKHQNNLLSKYAILILQIFVTFTITTHARERIKVCLYHVPELISTGNLLLDMLLLSFGTKYL